MVPMKRDVWASNHSAALPMNSNVAMARVYQLNGNAIWNRVIKNKFSVFVSVASH